MNRPVSRLSLLGVLLTSKLNGRMMLLYLIINSNIYRLMLGKGLLLLLLEIEFENRLLNRSLLWLKCLITLWLKLCLWVYAVECLKRRWRRRLEYWFVVYNIIVAISRIYTEFDGLVLLGIVCKLWFYLIVWKWELYLLLMILVHIRVNILISNIHSLTWPKRCETLLVC